MTLESVREEMAALLRARGVDALCAWPDGERVRRSGAVAAVSLRRCEGGPAGFRDYLGERYNPESGRWEELYGRKVRLVFGLDLYAPGAAQAQTALDRLAGALHQGGPGGLQVMELSAGEAEYDGTLRLFRGSEAGWEGWGSGSSGCPWRRCAPRASGRRPTRAASLRTLK